MLKWNKNKNVSKKITRTLPIFAEHGIISPKVKTITAVDVHIKSFTKTFELLRLLVNFYYYSLFWHNSIFVSGFLYQIAEIHEFVHCLCILTWFAIISVISPPFNIEILDGGSKIEDEMTSFDVIWRHNLPCRASFGVCNQFKFMSLCLKRTKIQRGASSTSFPLLPRWGNELPCTSED